MQGLAKLTKLEAKVLFLRDPVVLLVALAVPIGILLVFGLPGFARDPAPELGGQRPIDTVLPSIALAISVGVLAISALPGYLAIYREKGILRRLSTTPASPAMLLIAQVAVDLAMLVAALVLVLGIGAAWLDMPASAGWFVVAFVLGAAALFAVGLVIAAVAPTARAANAIGLLVFFPSLFLAGAWLPKYEMPAWLSRAGDLSPLGAFREAVQDAWVGTTPDPVHLAALAVVTVVAGTAAAKLFRWE
jgi:ABC-2 type transport system permease protein